MVTNVSDPKAPKYSIDDLQTLMARLRKPETGCPWDIEQNYLSITPSTIEEVYEVVDAIEQQDYAHLKEELGDLLFQVIFYAQLGREDGHFSFDDIVDGLTAKLIRRHPHVFPTGQLASEREPGEAGLKAAQQVSEQWDKIKQSERQQNGNSGLISDIPKALPALQRAQKLQKRVAKQGMDWRSVNAAVDKLDEEVAELKQAIKEGEQVAIKDELGDVLFTCVNVARKLKMDADQSLRVANTKFERRIESMQALIDQQDLSWKTLDDDGLDALWQQAKSQVKQ